MEEEEKLEDYLQGQVDLINKIKQDLSVVIEKSSPDDMLFDVVSLLKTIVPLKKNPDHSSK